MACSTEDQGGELAGSCHEEVPLCLEACGSTTRVSAICGINGWECSGGVAAEVCDLECEGTPTQCVDVCGDEPYEAECDAGEWSCGVGRPADECLTCSGSPGVCVEACGSEVELAEPICEGNLWKCSEGILESSCGPCDGEEPLECVESCEEGDIYEAECMDETWDCGDGVLLEECASSCSDQTVPCLEQCGSAVAVGEATILARASNE